MKNNNTIDDRKEKVYLTQAEMAERFRTSESTIKNWRDRGYLPYTRFPESTHVIYPVKEIEEIEKQFTFPGKEVVSSKRGKSTEIRKVKPSVSSIEKEWRI